MFKNNLLCLLIGLVLFLFHPSETLGNNLSCLGLLEAPCPDSIHIEKLHIHSDTVIAAESLIAIDSLIVDADCEIRLIAPIVIVKDTVHLGTSALVTISGVDGCLVEDEYDDHLKHRGIYINGFVSDGILGNEVKEDSLIHWCLDQKLNNVYLYNIGAALSSGMDEELSAFTYKANCLDLEVTYVSAGFGTSFSNIIQYHKDYDTHPQGIVSEIEFWNGSKDYETDYVPWLERLNDLKFELNPDVEIILNPTLKRRFYIGKIKDPGFAPSLGIAEDLIEHHDEIFLTNYHSNGYNLSTSTSENSIRNKLSLLGEAAKNLGTVANIVVLFNVRQDSPAPNIWSYFSEDSDDHEFIEAYQNFYEDFMEAVDITDKEYLNLKGFGIYRYTDATVARPGGE